MMITGTFVNYYFHCIRHLWLFYKNIRCEDTSEDVKIGKFISDNTYQRKQHEIHIDDSENEISIDFYDKKRKVIHEVKKSKRMEELHIWQMKYYLYVFQKQGIEVIHGEIDYPKQKKVLKVLLNDDDIKNIEMTVEKIRNVLSSNTLPKVINKPYCKKCSYYEFCYC